VLAVKPSHAVGKPKKAVRFCPSGSGHALHGALAAARSLSDNVKSVPLPGAGE
jgi:hypothetical protein